MEYLMRDVIDMEWILRELEFQMKFSNTSDSKIINAFGCDKMIKQALHVEFIQSIGPILPPNVNKNFLLLFDDFYYERFTLDDMNLRGIFFENKDGKEIVLTGDINNYLADDIENSLQANQTFFESKIRFLNVEKVSISNGYGESVFLSEPFPYPVNIIYGSFTYLIPTKKHKYSVFLKSVGATVKDKHAILSDLKKNTFRIDFEYSDIDLQLGEVMPLPLPVNKA